MKLISRFQKFKKKFQQQLDEEIRGIDIQEFQYEINQRISEALPYLAIPCSGIIWMFYGSIFPALLYLLVSFVLFKLGLM